MQKNLSFEATCIDITTEGFGVVKYEDFVIFVANLLPQEKALIKVVSVKKNYGYGIILKLIASHVQRVNPKCNIYNKCGSCTLQHCDYELQAQLKQQWAATLLSEFGNVEPLIKAEKTERYRNKIQVPFKDGQLGYYRSRSNDIIPFEDCLLQSALSNEILFFIRDYLLKNDLDIYFRHLMLRHNHDESSYLIILIVNKDISKKLNELCALLIAKYSIIKGIVLNINQRSDNVILGDKDIILYGIPYIEDELCKLTFRIGIHSFYQIHHQQCLKLYNCIAEVLKPQKDEILLDLYCGIGTIGLSMAHKVKELIGVEIIPEAIANARHNASLNKINNAQFYCDDITKNYDKYLNDVDIVVVDPPRKGLSNALIQELNNHDIKRLVYVSCNPHTLKRDLKLLQESYNIDRIIPCDMFPNTNHIECVVLLSKA